MQAAPQAPVEQAAQAVQRLRATLEQNHLPGLEQAVLDTQAALRSLELFPGGIEGLRAAIDQQESSERQRLTGLLAQAKHDHQLNSELIRLAMQRNAALQAYAAQSSAAATYSSEGAVSFGAGGQLLGKF